MEIVDVELGCKEMNEEDGVSWIGNDLDLIPKISPAHPHDTFHHLLFRCAMT